METLDKTYWQNRYETGETGWDIGSPSTPIKEYIDQLTDKNIRILVPGCGNAWEAEYLWESGFRHTFVIDIAPDAIRKFRERVPGFPENQLIEGDFFNFYPEETFDLVIEQTFFCAINPSLRTDYARQMHRILKPGGKLAGLLFDDVLNTDKPPFGGNAEIYRPFFEPYFNFKTFGKATNSIEPRAGRELFFIFTNK